MLSFRSNLFPTMLMRSWLFLLVGLFSAAAVLRVPAARAACGPSDASEKTQIAQVGDRLDIVLADGRRIFFPAIEPPRATPAAPQRPEDVAAQLDSLLRGKTLALLPLGGVDRWGRIPSRLYIEGESGAVDEDLAAAGLVVTRADPGACGAGARAAEAEARAAKLGVWADPAFAVLAPDDPTSFAPRAGTLAIVEGEIRSVGRSFGRTYLNFVARHGGVSLVIRRHNLPAFEKAGLSAKSLVNRRIRARGVVEISASPQIELFHPGQIEFMEEGSQPGRPP